jgi:hypothetical protein
VANQPNAGKLITETFDGEPSRKKVRFGSIINDGYWGHVDVSGTVMIEMRNVPVGLAVQIGELLRDAPNLHTG